MKELYRSKNNVVIGVDEFQWTVADVTTVPVAKPDGAPNKLAGEERFNNMKFYSSIESACKHAANKMAKQDANTLSEFVKAHSEAAEAICLAISGKDKG